jgi:hypothetical protein
MLTLVLLPGYLLFATQAGGDLGMQGFSLAPSCWASTASC